MTLEIVRLFAEGFDCKDWLVSLFGIGEETDMLLVLVLLEYIAFSMESFSDFLDRRDLFFLALNILMGVEMLFKSRFVLEVEGLLVMGFGRVGRSLVELMALSMDMSLKRVLFLERRWLLLFL